MNILLINLTRFGDLLQMQPLILGLKAQGHQVGLLCLENFAPATVLLRGIDFVLPLCGSTFLQALEKDSSHTQQAWPLAIEHVESLVQKVYTAFPPQQIINTTATLSARLLARRLVLAAQNATQNSQDAPQEIPILGFGLDDHGFGQSGDMWTTFLQGASAERLNCPFNIVDMFRSVAKVAHFPPLHGLAYPAPHLQESAKAFLQTSITQSTAPPNNAFGTITKEAYVAFQLGASEAKRQWPLASFVALGEKLWQEAGLCPVLLGSPAEKHLAQKYAALAKHPFVDAIGKTDFPQLAALVQQCALLVSNDTGTMHLAAGLNVPVLALFLATAQAFDTGPYAPNTCCLEPALPCHPCPFHQPCAHGDNQPCLDCIDAATVAHLVQHFLQHGNWKAPENMSHTQEVHAPNIRIWQSVFDATGFMQLEGLSGHECEERTHWLCVQRQFYRALLDDNFPQDFAFQSQHIQGLSANFRQDIVRTLSQCTQLLLLVKEHMQLLQRKPSKQGGQRILSTCTTIYGVLEKCGPLKALGHLWLVLFQERGGQWETFGQLVHNIREALIILMKALEYQSDT